MALQCRIGISKLLFWLMLLHLGWMVELAMSDAPGCPTYPADPTWKNSFSKEEMSSGVLSLMRKLRFYSGTFEQGSKVLFTRSGSNVSDSVQGVSVVVVNAAQSAYRDVYSVSVRLTLGFWNKFVGGRFRAGGRGRPKIVGNRGGEDLTIVGEGLFHEKTGELCVVGCIQSVCKYKLSLSYPVPKTIHQLSIVGNLTSMVRADNAMFFEPVTIKAVSDAPVQYTMNDTEAKYCPNAAPDVQATYPGYLTSGTLWREENVCKEGWLSYQGLNSAFQVNWSLDCKGADCSPFANVGKAGAGTPSVLQFDRVRCDGNRIQGILVVTSSSRFSDLDRFADPTTTDGMLLFEGTWDSVSGKLCMIACRLSGKEDCEIAVTMQFPLTFTVTQRSVVVGHIKSLRSPAVFKPITFRRISTGLQLARFTSLTSQPEYVYSKVETAKRLCAKDQKKTLSGTYPSGEDWRDLEIQGFRDKGKMSAFVSFNLFTVGNQFRTFGQLHSAFANVTGLVEQGVRNVSYSIYYQIDASNSTVMAGEGGYDPTNGKLCLIACRAINRQMKDLEPMEGEGDSPQDCQIFVNIQLPRKDSTDVLKGTVKSLRIPSDRLYFKPDSFSGIAHMQAVASVWRVDLEIVLSVVMLSLTVVFIILQLVYSKRYPETLPYISTSMLLLLSLAHMIPLVLNFEALFQKKTHYKNLAMAGGWPELNEVVVRLTTMTAMLLQLRLLQLVGKSRFKSRATGDLAAAVHERRVLYIILPFYVVGGLVAVLFHAYLGFKPIERDFLWRGNQGGLWGDVRAYGGLLLDFHLFPQVVGNILWGAKEQAPLSKPFYFGMALVRSLPHIYDLCRQFRFIPSYVETYLYANPEWDFYSVTSDILIPSGILLLAIMVYMQQRWGGRCLLPRRWRSSFEYEKVAVIGT